MGQLIDYSSTQIAEATPVAVLLIHTIRPELSDVGEYFTEQLIFTLSREEDFQNIFRMVERKNLQQLLEELELQLGGLVEDSQAAQVGKLLGAELLISGLLYKKAEDYELFIKMLRVDTGKILSVSKAVLDKRPGI
ncbi:MAG: hypothetical protein FVQ80_18770 [Planctomycetes bacterium]|nr:hypothetical protein [Planctomycetota bacterium]